MRMSDAARARKKLALISSGTTGRTADDLLLLFELLQHLLQHLPQLLLLSEGNIRRNLQLLSGDDRRKTNDFHHNGGTRCHQMRS
jgi:hypothetical protein